MGMTTTVAVIMTSHNRRALTIQSVRAILDEATDDIRIKIYATDDGSVDGTAEALRSLDDRIEVLAGDGNLYWAAGMALAERRAVLESPDYLLWLNDDTVVDDGALDVMLAVARSLAGAIVVGATRDPLSGEVTYGARLRVSRWHPQRLVGLPASSQIQVADSFNGNLVLVPWQTRRRVGPIDDLFPHAYADDDYGLRAVALGVTVVQAPGTLAVCERGPARLPAATGPRRWLDQQNPKGLPLRAQYRFMRRHAGRAWPLVLAGQQLSWLVRRPRTAR